ncbi:hypothetical protein FO519_007912 [Halicephalobus sp. NKZ332]|nr:hypothetical protein FO519_007912 [Halicephalobus sp. NKZ332]
MSTSTNWFSEFILITYDINGVINNGTANNVNDFVDLYNEYTSDISGGCILDIIPSVLEVINDYNVPPKSIIYCTRDYRLQTITIFGVNNEETLFTREFKAVCYGKYHRIAANIVFIIDVSQAVNAVQSQDTTQFVLDALEQFNLNYLEGIQVGLISVFGDDVGTMMQYSDFSGIYSYNSLWAALTNAYSVNTSPSGFGQAALSRALNFTMSSDFKASGYRSDINNHVIVYITTTSTPDQAAIDQASVILSSGDYKIIAISYQGDGSNINALQKLVGNNSGCVLTSLKYTKTFTDSFAEKIANASNNGGNYC